MINLKGRNLLTLLDFEKLEIEFLLKQASVMKQKKASGVYERALREKNIVLLFEKPSTRTRCAFELAGKEEGANVTVLTNSHLGKKESIEDTANILGCYYDGILFRGSDQKLIDRLAHHAGVPVWNGLTNQFHPTQALADIMTIEEHIKKPLCEIKVVYVGDLGNNVAISLMIICAKLGLHYVGLGAKSLFPSTDLLHKVEAIAKPSGGTVFLTENIASAVNHADVIYTDVWVSMGEELQIENRIKLLKPYQVNREMLLATHNSEIKFMHCLPACHDTKTEIGKYVKANFGLSAMEVTDDVFRSTSSLVYPQALNRIHTAKAVMIATIRGSLIF